MRRITVFLIILAAVSLSAYSVDFRKVSLNVEIPEDYNVVVPDGCTMLDKFVLELQLGALSDTSLNPGRSASAGTLSKGTSLSISDSIFDGGSMRLTMLYYGNLSYDYRVRVSGGSESGWILGKGAVLPISVSFNRNSEADGDIEVAENIDGSVDISVPPSGIRQGVPVADIILSWDRIMEIVPGKYSADIVLSLEAM